MKSYQQVEIFLSDFEMICSVMLVLEDLANLLWSKNYICWRICLSKYIILMHTSCAVSGCVVENVIE